MRFALAILIVLQLADLATTAYDQSTGYGHEGNPLMAAALAGGGILALAAVKAGVIAYATALVVWVREGRGRRFLDFALRAGAIGTAYIVYSNLVVGGLV